LNQNCESEVAPVSLKYSKALSAATLFSS